MFNISEKCERLIVTAILLAFMMLAIGDTVTLPELFATTGAKFAFDAETLGKAVDLIERTIADLEQQI